MGIVAMIVALILLTVGAGGLLWMLLLHFDEIRAAAEYEVQQPTGAALLFLTLAALLFVGTLAVLLVEVQQLFIPASS